MQCRSSLGPPLPCLREALPSYLCPGLAWPALPCQWASLHSKYEEMSVCSDGVAAFILRGSFAERSRKF